MEERTLHGQVPVSHRLIQGVSPLHGLQGAVRDVRPLPRWRRHPFAGRDVVHVTSGPGNGPSHARHDDARSYLQFRAGRGHDVDGVG